MKKQLVSCLTGLMLATLPFYVALASGNPETRSIEPIISTQWLEDNLSTPDLVILDIRSPDAYAKGHVPGALNLPGLGTFYVNLFNEKFPWMELPEDKALLTAIGNAGITPDSRVVVVGRTSDPMACYAVADATRVAVTLLYAGIPNVAILDGGHDKWAADGKKTATRPVTPDAVPYTGAVRKDVFVSKDDVVKKMPTCTLVEARDADVYFGLVQEPWTKKAGHIPGAKCLPSPWFWSMATDKNGVVTQGTYKPADTAREMASAVVGEDPDGEIIVYCGVGGYASALYYVLTQVLEYQEVRIYDGSMQEWTADPKAGVVRYRYE